MGHRAYLSVHTTQKEEEVFESNNFLPFFWITLFGQQHLAAILPAWLHYEMLCLDPEREEELDRYTDGWPSPCSIRITKEELTAYAKDTTDFFAQYIPSYTRLYDDFTSYLLGHLPDCNDHIRVDIIAMAAFSDVTEFAAQLKHTLNALKTQHVNDLGMLETDPVLLIGFPYQKDFAEDTYPELRQLQRQLKLQQAPAAATGKQRRSGKRNYAWVCVLVLSGILFIYASVRGYHKEGLTFKVAMVHLLGWIALAGSVYGFQSKRKS